eukprot:m.203435 g.203435  ORF g.203435 m.203435 type:complete len:390 (+) comp39623_c0_seq1:551-1720(+)
MVNLVKCLLTAFPSCQLQIPFVFGAVALAMHVDCVGIRRSGVPIVVLKGPCDSGKTMAARSAYSCLGLRDSLGSSSKQLLFDVFSYTTFGTWLDDPKKLDLYDLIVNTYNRVSVGSFQRGMTRPHCSFLMTCNFAFGAIDRLLSRLVVIPFGAAISCDSDDKEQERARENVTNLQMAAASSIGYFIALGRKYAETSSVELRRIDQFVTRCLPQCLNRIHGSYVDLLWFTQQIAKECGISQEVLSSSFAESSQMILGLLSPAESGPLSVCEILAKDSACVNDILQSIVNVVELLFLGKLQVATFLSLCNCEGVGSIAVKSKRLLELLQLARLPEVSMSKFKESAKHQGWGISDLKSTNTVREFIEVPEGQEQTSDECLAPIREKNASVQF